MKQFFFLLVIPFFIACSGNKVPVDNNKGDTLLLKYAKNICIVKYSDHINVSLSDPWNKGRILHSYSLYNGDNNSKPIDGSTPVHIPLNKSLISTSVHCELAKILESENAVRGICDAKYFNSAWVKNKLKSGDIVDCGNSMQPDIEKIIVLQPDAIFLSPMQNTGGYGKVENLNIPIIEIADYMESTALGRAEWIKFYGILFGKEQQADSLFSAYEKEYLKFKAIASRSKIRPKVVVDKTENGIWYLPGGKSTIAQLLADANCQYAYSTDASAGSIVKSRESVVSHCSNCDLWFVRYAKVDGKQLTINELKSDNAGYAHIKALKNGNVWGCNTVTSTFFEETPFQPHLLLKDFVIISHPDINSLGNTKYFFKLK